MPPALAAELKGRNAFAVIWTTTPWTLPANLAIAVQPSQSYVTLDVTGEVHVVAKARLEEDRLVLERAAKGRGQLGPAGSELPGPDYGGGDHRRPRVRRRGPEAGTGL